MPLDSKTLKELIPRPFHSLMSSKGREFVDRVGNEVIKEVVLNVLSGRNLRDSTEMVTRRRLGLLNAATTALFVSGKTQFPNFIDELPKLAANGLLAGKNSKEERWLLEWTLGLTDKATQNVLRDDKQKITEYTKEYEDELVRLVEQARLDYGDLGGQISIGNNTTSLGWRFVIQLLGTIGAQTLAIRGSEKSVYGKLFERLILGSVLSLLGFEYGNPIEVNSKHRIFWLSDRSDKRESDATALIALGKGIRFDIGFIGRGNPEITLDKITRYEKEMTVGSQKWYMGTYVVVDRVGKGSRIEELAKGVGGTIIQMSLSYWPKRLAQELKTQQGHVSEILDIPDSDLENYIGKKIRDLDLGIFLQGKNKAKNRRT